MNEELEEKTARLVELLERENIGAVLLNSQHNFAWLTGGGTNGIDISRENGAASLLVTRTGKRFVVANNIEMPRMLSEEISAEILGHDFEPVEYSWQDEKANSSFVIDKAKQLLEAPTTIAAIATDIPIDPATPAIENKIAVCRYRLTNPEIDRYRSLGHDAGASIRKVIDKLGQGEGETELEIAEKMRHELALGGMTPVLTLVAADERISQFRHPIPTANRWKKTLLLVTCAKRQGLIASLSRMICAGNIPDELKIKTEAAAYVNACLLDATRSGTPGTTGAELYAAAANAYANRGFAGEINRHHQGGAAGYKTREWVAHPRSAEVVHTGQAFAWNPSLTGTKVEETCLTAADEGDGVEVITASPDFPQIASAIKGREYFSPGILSL